jgi:phosphatidylinositol glycan class T
LELSFEYDPLFLNFERFPADPNRGFELPPLVAHLTSGCPAEPDCRDDTCPVASATLYSDTPLILAPVPDMSMPFNVISLTCTIYAFIIGSFIHLIVRKGSERVKFSLHPESKPKPPVQRIKEAVSRRFRVLITRLAGAVKAARRAGDPEERSPEIE